MGADMSDKVEAELQELSRGLTHLIFRNARLVEELHVKQMAMDDEVMKILNIEINNRIYTLLTILLYGTEEERLDLLRHIQLSSFYGRGTWETARKVEI